MTDATYLEARTNLLSAMADAYAHAATNRQDEFREANASAVEARRVFDARRTHLINEATNNAVNALALTIQDALGQDDGGIAAMALDRAEDTIRQIAANYLKTEENFAFPPIVRITR